MDDAWIRFERNGYRAHQGKVCTLRSNLRSSELCGKPLDFREPAEMTQAEHDEWLQGHGLEGDWARRLPGVQALAFFAGQPPEHLVVEPQLAGCPVSLFEREGSLVRCADRLDDFLATLAGGATATITGRMLESACRDAKGLMAQGRWSEASARLAEVLPEPPPADRDWVETLRALRGHCLVQLGRDEEAVAELARVGRVQYDARVLRAAVLSLRLGRHAQALELTQSLLLDSFVAVDPGRATTLRHVQAFSGFHLGHTDQAASTYLDLFQGALAESGPRPGTGSLDEVTTGGLLGELRQLEHAGIAPAALETLRAKCARKLKLHELRARRKSTPTTP